MSSEAVISSLFAADEFTAFSVQSIHCWNGTGSVVPRARLDGHKTGAPCCSAVPKPGNVENPTRRRSEFNDKLSLLNISGTGGKALFPTTPKRDGLGICADCKD